MTIPLSRVTLLLLLLLFILPWVILWFALPRSVDQGVPSDRVVRPAAELPSTAAALPEATQRMKVRSGPWGELEISELTISPPLEFVSSLDMSTLGNDWHFPQQSREDVEGLLTKAPLEEGLRRELSAAIVAAPEIQGFKIPRREKFVRRLSPEARAIIYGQLGQWGENPEQVNAFRFCGDSVDQWLENADLSDETLAALQPLIYRNGRFLMFSDVPLVRDVAAKNGELDQLYKVLSRERTLLIKLRVDDSTDIDSVVAYWGQGGRQKDVRPILESLREQPGGGTIDITHLLPPFARRRIYTYPAQINSEPYMRRDCHWTAINFFSDGSIAEMAGIDHKLEVLESEYHRYEGEPQLGDLVHYVDDQDAIYHSAVYLAADILFTRNGTRSARPWMFLFRDEMKDYYPKSGDIRVIFTRRNDM